MVQYAEGPSIGTTEAVAVGAMLRQEVEVVQVEAETNLEMTGRVGWMADVVGDIPAMTATDPEADDHVDLVAEIVGEDQQMEAMVDTGTTGREAVEAADPVVLAVGAVVVRL